MKNNEDVKKVKYVHLLWHNEAKFNSRVVAMIHDPATDFNSQEHLFVTPHQLVYDAIKDYDNVVLDNTYGSRKAAGYVNRYAPQCEWLFLHSMCSPLEALKIKGKCWHKIVHRTWGGDLSYDLAKNTGVKKFAKRIINKIFAWRMKHVRLIGVANTVDILNVQEQIGNVATHIMPYPVKDSDTILLEEIAKPKKSDGKLCVMIGHSGHPINNHKELLDALYRFRDENIQIYIILAYGYPDYIEEVKTYGSRLYGEKITFIEEMLPYDRYVQLINEMDIAFFDGVQSYALGNIYIFKVLRKKIFLHEDGIIRRAFDLEKIPYVCSSQLADLSFEEFAKPIDYSEETRNKLIPIPYEKSVETWHDILNVLDS